MPNRPDDPYARFPPAAAIGLLLMLSGAGALLVLNTPWLDWRSMLLGAIVLFALIGTALVLRRLKRRPFAVGGMGKAALPLAAGQGALPAFDPASFVEAVRQRHPTPSPRRIEQPRRKEEGTAADRTRPIGAETVRRLQDLRDHPATPPAERQAAADKLKKTRTKRRSAWRKGP